ncbi:MAG: bestrophin family ion channel [Polyangiales bacterium]
MIVPDRKMSWFGLLFDMRGSTLPRIAGRLLAVFVVACAVTVESYVTGGVEHDLSVVPFTLISLALGVFLGFRNNTSYDRYWEGRKLWGRLVNDARSVARLTLHLIAVDATPNAKLDEPGTRALQRDLIYRVIAYVHALRMHLRNEISELAELEPFLRAEEIAALPVQRNVPMAILNTLSSVVQKARRAGVLRHRDVHLLEAQINDLCDIQGGCERIKNTPIPWSYTVLMHSIVAAYCFALPFGLIATVQLATPLVVALIAYAFLGLDAVGDELEEPFGKDVNDLPLSQLSRMIEVNLRQALGEEELPPMLVPGPDRMLS